jgi:CBS-domain-containing membrane protein
MMTDLKKVTVSADASLRRVMEVIDRGARQIALVTDDSGVLIATVTDGDVRRGLLKGLGMEEPVSEVMYRNPATLPKGASAASAQRLMRERGLNHIPVVDTEGRLRAASVVDCPAERGAIGQAIAQVLTPAFRAAIRRQANPYGDGVASGRTVAAIENWLGAGTAPGPKRFHDLPATEGLS